MTEPSDDASRVSWKAIVALVLTVAALLTPTVASVPLSAGGLVLAFLARRELKRRPGLTAGKLWLPAAAISGFVFVFQAIMVGVPYFAAVR